MTRPNAPQHPDDPEAHLPPSHNPLPELSGGRPGQITEAAFVEVQNSDEFDRLRRTFRGFAFPMTAAFLLWYFAYVLASVYAKDFMSQPFLGMPHFNLGHFLGLLQFLTTFLITWLYIRHANSKLDPIATRIRERLEGGAR